METPAAMSEVRVVTYSIKGRERVAKCLDYGGPAPPAAADHAARDKRGSSFRIAQQSALTVPTVVTIMRRLGLNAPGTAWAHLVTSRARAA
jgi:hypothetical protein